MPANDFLMGILLSENAIQDCCSKWLRMEGQQVYEQFILLCSAAYQFNCRFVLICDNRRPDLASSFDQTIDCIKDEFMDLKTNSMIIYWQEIAQVCGIDLQQFLKEKYGIC